MKALQKLVMNGDSKQDTNNWFLKNGEMLLEEVVASCNGKCNPIQTFSSEEITKATNNYRHEYAWDGGYRLCKGFLQDRQVSIKRYDAHGSHFGLENILKDIVIGSNMSVHKNCLRLLGCCLETQNPMVVYEFVGDTLLSQCLKSDSPLEPLTWKQRLKIAMDIANAVAYLHTAFPRPIIHRDIKASSIILDQNGAARLLDFSLAISIPEGQSHLETGVCGRTGFGAPEYVAAGYLTEKADVYLFGMLLFHLLTGYHVFQVTRLANDEYVTLRGGRELREETKKLIEVVDPSILKEGMVMVEHEQLLALSSLALSCIHDMGGERPTMIDVAKRVRQIYRSVPCYTVL